MPAHQVVEDVPCTEAGKAAVDELHILLVDFCRAVDAHSARRVEIVATHREVDKLNTRSQRIEETTTNAAAHVQSALLTNAEAATCWLREVERICD